MAKLYDFDNNHRQLIKTIVSTLKEELECTNDDLAKKLLTKYESLKNWLRESIKAYPPKSTIYRMGMLHPNALKIIEQNQLLGEDNSIYAEIHRAHEAEKVLRSKKVGAESIDSIIEKYQSLARNYKVLVFGFQNTLESTGNIENKELGFQIKSMLNNCIYIVPCHSEIKKESLISNISGSQINHIDFLTKSNFELNPNGISHKINHECEISNEGYNLNIPFYVVNFNKFISHLEITKKLDSFEVSQLEDARSALFCVMSLKRALFCIQDEKKSIYESIPYISTTKGLLVPSLNSSVPITRIDKLANYLLDELL